MKAKPAFRLLVLIIGPLLCGGGLWILLRPAEYKATVQIEIVSDMGITDCGCDTFKDFEKKLASQYRDFLKTQFEAIRSEVVLSNVVEALELNVEWGKRYGSDQILGTEETIKMLRRSVNLQVERKTNLIEIGVWDENPVDAAVIANAIADAYKNYRREKHREEAEIGIEKMEENYRAEEAKIQPMQSNVDQLRKRLNITDTNGAQVMPASMGQTSPYREAELDLQDTRELHNMLAAKIKSDKDDSLFPKASLVTVINPAVAPTAPAPPNRWLGALLLICGLAISSFGLSSLRNGGMAKVDHENSNHL